MGSTFSQWRRRWLLPPGFGELISRACERAKSAFSPARRSEAQRLRRNGAFQNQFRGRRCFVIGNGPSLAGQDLAPLRDEVTLVMNAFYRHPILATCWRPTFHCMAEPADAYNDPQIMNLLRECARLEADVHVLPAATGRLVASQSLLPAEKLLLVEMRGRTADGPPPGPADLTKPVPYMSNTAHLAIITAMYLGCSPIYLLGLDHDWLAHRGNDRHFYQPTGAEAEVGGHWDLATYPYLDLMEMAVQTWKDYIWLQQMAGLCGTTILNATDGGFLDVFERVSYEEILHRREAA